MLPVGHTQPLISAAFSHDNKKIVTIALDGTAKIWETSSGKLVRDIPAGGDASMVYIETVEFTPDDNKIIVRYQDGGGGSKLIDLRTGDKWENWYSDFYLDQLSPDGKKLIFGDSVFNVDTHQPLFGLRDKKSEVSLVTFSSDGKKILAFSPYNGEPAEGEKRPAENAWRIYDATTGKPLCNYQHRDEYIESVVFTPDGKRIVVLMENSAEIFDATTLKRIGTLQKYSSNEMQGFLGHKFIQFSPDGSKIFYTGAQQYDEGDAEADYQAKRYYNELTAWDSRSGKLLYKLNKLYLRANIPFISKDGKKLLLIDSTRNVNIVDANTGKRLSQLTGQNSQAFSVAFSPNGQNIVSGTADGTVYLWDAVTYKMISSWKAHEKKINDIRFSSDGKRIITAANDFSAKTWDVSGKRQQTIMKALTDNVKNALFTKDGKGIVIFTSHGKMLWDIESGRFEPVTIVTDSLVIPINGPDGMIISPDSVYNVYSVADIINIRTEGGDIMWPREREVSKSVMFSPDSKNLLITGESNTVRLARINDQKTLFTFITLDSGQYLVADANNHYDGTDLARKQLHFVCGDEVIGLEQVKDQLWVPGLAERIMKGEAINAVTTEQLNLCGLTPLVQDVSNATEFHFKIIPRRGGIGETVLSVNNIEVKRYQPSQIKTATGGYELIVKKNELDSFMINGESNYVTVKTFTSDNTISSRGGKLEVSKTAGKLGRPNLYAVIIGVSDYKGNDIDLKFAAKDATDLSRALTISAKKLLNTDSAEHVFTYNMTTAPGHYMLPEKKAIKAVIDSIGKKARSNDILLVFFAGHGMAAGTEKKQFYFLTSDASSLTAVDAFKEVGISTTELMDWTMPQNVKAQKRILIFDACQSGQAINDFVKLGNDNQNFIAARSDDDAQQKKTIDKLNEKSGFFIFSASSSDQNAYEMTNLSQGLLTYSLLKAMKQNPNILDNDKYLNVQKWFDAAGETVIETIKQMTANEKRQEPQIISTTNFDIGVIDPEVTAVIILPQEKPIFAASNFQNSDENAGGDDLDLGLAVNKELGQLSARGDSQLLMFLANSNAVDAYSLTGRYDVTENSVVVRVNIRQNKEVKFRFELTGNKDKLKDLAIEISKKAAEWVGKK